MSYALQAFLMITLWVSVAGLMVTWATLLWWYPNRLP